MSKVSTGDFSRIKEIVETLKEADSSYQGPGVVGDFHYEASVHNNKSGTKVLIYRGRSFTTQPQVILELEKLAEEPSL
ncbi:hypothetical protein [Roseivirga pacifica]|uniref:hypothetical protein n=1 Tax=Roseivirga pacifica TaxID=1267423 RepID=UPI003BAE4EA3